MSESGAQRPHGATTGGARPADRATFAAVVVVIAATYGYFLIFAEFAFLELLRVRAGSDGLRPPMAALGLAGVAGSAAAAWFFRIEAWARSLRWGAVACAVAAIAACGRAGIPAAAGIGLALGWTTVTLASGLRAALGVRRLGLAVGLGTGAAYAACNLPWIFQAEPRVQAGISIGFMLLAAAMTRGLKTGAADSSDAPDFKAGQALSWTVIFMALVWMDSAAFYIIQHTPALKEETWSEGGSLAVNATIHFLVAAGAGLMLDRGWLGRVALGSWAALAFACVLLADGVREAMGAEILYTAGVSLYSVALVYYPARGGRAWLAGAVFAVAGWIGSALGIGMAQDLKTVPGWFVVIAGVVVAGLLMARQRTRVGLRQPLVMLAVIGAGVLALPATSLRAEVEDEGALVLRGREVFIGEGCIHCHSQFVRPGTTDVALWGPSKPLAESLAETPPLLGNRRQGPDLMEVGNRRSREWNRLHLIAPRAVSPGSRMPSYAHLFRDGDGRGEALVAYLGSLGAETAGERAALAQAWAPPPEVAGDLVKGTRLFEQLCANCHGPEGKGNGALAGKLSVRPPDWTRDGWRFVDAADEARSVARIIKFGVPGSPMAGHEYLRDEEIVSLARHVRGLHVGATVP